MSIKLTNTTNKKGEWNITFTAVSNHACHTIYILNEYHANYEYNF